MPQLQSLHKRILILGGYGTFGSRIAELLASERNLQIILAGRDRFKAELLANRLRENFPQNHFEGLRLDREAINFPAQLQSLNLDLLIHCAGPFQQQDYRVAQACIDSGTSYIDIADSTRYVCDIRSLNDSAQRAETTLISGASSLPALSSAVLAEVLPAFSSVESLEIDIAPGHRITRGLAAVRAGFEALGKTFSIRRAGAPYETYAGDELRKVEVGHPVGERWVCNFQVPDLELIPANLPSIENLRFGTGVQPRILQLGLALCARLARVKLPRNVPPLLPYCARAGHWLAARWPGGSEHGGMVLEARGKTQTGENAVAHWRILGLNGDGPWIPAAPAAAMAKKFLRGEVNWKGAVPCWQLLTLEEILAELTQFAIVTSFEQPQRAMT